MRLSLDPALRTAWRYIIILLLRTLQVLALQVSSGLDQSIQAVLLVFVLLSVSKLLELFSSLLLSLTLGVFLVLVLFLIVFFVFIFLFLFALLVNNVVIIFALVFSLVFTSSLF